MKADLLERYKKIDWNKLLRKDLGDYSLEEAKVIFDRIKKVLDDITSSEILSGMSTNAQNLMNSLLSSFLDSTRQILDFKDINQRAQYLNIIKDLESRIATESAPILSYLRYIDPNRDANLKKNEEDFKKKVEELNQKIAKSDELLNSAQNRAVKAEVDYYGDFFKETSSLNDKRAKIAFWSMVGSIVLTAIFSVAILHGKIYIDFEKTNFFQYLLKIVYEQNIFLKLVLISLGGYLVSHFARTYSAERHLYYLNTQRQNALDSHRQILDSIKSTDSENDKEVANAILLELTRAIFDANNTGYLKNCGNSQNPATQFIEVTKNLK